MPSLINCLIILLTNPYFSLKDDFTLFSFTFLKKKVKQSHYALGFFLYSTCFLNITLYAPFCIQISILQLNTTGKHIQEMKYK